MIKVTYLTRGSKTLLLLVLIDSVRRKEDPNYEATYSSLDIKFRIVYGIS